MTVTLWVVGGPGSGKGTQCEKIVEKYGFLHLSSGDLLREEVASGSPRGGQLQELMSKGLFVPSDVVLSLIKERINKGKEDKVPGFLIDGYPRELSQGLEFEKEIGTVDLVLFFDVANETLTKRLLGRAASSGRADDNEETIKKRIEVFNEKNGPIIEHYKAKVVKINAEGGVDEIFAEATKAIDAVQKA
ncbi:adenylate kinase isoenzyme 1 isoform X2 [Athalia rosae]|nr:adenylate kinase isoenzyme 1 isoform X2 [Athalia rosae]XP_012266123.1 adenylate kinase isoenzyme 1 isoform X2 [Athalia rosae]